MSNILMLLLFGLFVFGTPFIPDELLLLSGTKIPTTIGIILLSVLIWMVVKK